jgi:hypothetical protein
MAPKVLSNELTVSSGAADADAEVDAAVDPPAEGEGDVDGLLHAETTIAAAATTARRLARGFINWFSFVKRPKRMAR